MQHICITGYMLWPGVCLSVYLSVTSLCSTKTAERIELVFSTSATLNLSYIVFCGNFGISKIMAPLKSPCPKL